MNGDEYGDRETGSTSTTGRSRSRRTGDGVLGRQRHHRPRRSIVVLERALAAGRTRSGSTKSQRSADRTDERRGHAQNIGSNHREQRANQLMANPCRVKRT